MTARCLSAGAAKSKARLEAALNEDPSAVLFDDPGPWGICPSWGLCPFNGADIPTPDSFPVVLDPETRRRFAVVERRRDGTFRVR
jgi:hypothetical protein